jgi:BirA family biotin operon repressor/biotin-[acetyl-CoA-carboxylase] ligase
MSTFQIGNQIHHFETLESTNNYTANVFKKGDIKCGTVILADNQTKGRGQRDKSWKSLPYSSLTFSVALDGQKLDNQNPLRSVLISSLAVLNFLKSKQIDAKIKWPNDILVKNHKICGILIENFYRGKNIHFSVVGIGVNINQDDFGDFPATSLKIIKDKSFNLSDSLNSLLYQLNLMFNTYVNIPYDDLLTIYNSQLWKLNKEVKYLILKNDSIQKGTLLGANEQGDIKIQVNDKVVCYKNGDIKFLFKDQD